MQDEVVVTAHDITHLVGAIPELFPVQVGITAMLCS